jgi:hypothetical protein|tara:strand:+ start:314 stop:700 length:387 start_codon:yes stop_codon:yes gene_type:complete
MNLIYGILIGMILMYIFINKSKNEIKIEQQSRFIVKKLLRQTARWATAAKQDNNSMIAVLHANYGAGYLWALKDIVKTDIIEKITGINMMKFEAEIIKIQDTATKKMAKLCPKYAPKKSYLTSIAGEG